MTQCNGIAALLAIPPFSLLPLQLLWRLVPSLQEIARLICRFRDSQTTPEASRDFECQLGKLLLEVGRQIVEWAFNNCEPESRDLLPTQVRLEDAVYQRVHRKTANRLVGTLFGTITLMRYMYRPTEERLPSISPLEIRLGLEQARATPALADRVGQYSAQCTQQAVLQTLHQEHNVQWSVHLLRKVTGSVAAGMIKHRHAAQVAKVLKWLVAANASKGNRRPILSAGRDGIFAPIRGVGDPTAYREAAVATLSVYDRRGCRLGTVYLGQMPDEEQRALSSQLTSLIEDVLKQWTGPMPRLVYVTDAGHQQTRYYKRVLRRMVNPRSPGERLKWEWVLDYYHACQYVSDLAEVLFGEGREAQAWAAKMRRWLKHKSRGIHRVLHSAAALRERRGLVGSAKDYDKAYRYLTRRIRYLDYCTYRKLHLPIGSGVTEACCKTVITQRLKQSGMSWKVQGGQTIVDLRVVYLSGIWDAARQAHLRSKNVETIRTQMDVGCNAAKKAA
jgi:hypothetical protein